MSFDLGEFDALTRAQQEGVEMELKHPTTGEGLGVVLRVASYESQRVKDAGRHQFDKALKAQTRGRAPTSKELEEVAHEKIVAAILDWRGMVLHGEDLPCTRENARRVVTEFPWVGEQVDAFAQDRSAFFPS